MKALLIFIFLFLSVTILYSQKSNKLTIDTNVICIPNDVARKMLLDLNDYDRLKEVVVTYKNEIYELNNKVLFLQKENTAWSQNDKLNNDLIIEKNKTIEIYKSENQDLKKENKRLKTKNGLYMIISAIIITPLTYIAVTK